MGHHEKQDIYFHIKLAIPSTPGYFHIKLAIPSTPGASLASFDYHFFSSGPHLPFLRHF